jgi:hypothetical protein
MNNQNQNHTFNINLKVLLFIWATLIVDIIILLFNKEMAMKDGFNLTTLKSENLTLKQWLNKLLVDKLEELTANKK